MVLFVVVLITKKYFQRNNIVVKKNISIHIRYNVYALVYQRFLGGLMMFKRYNSVRVHTVSVGHIVVRESNDVARLLRYSARRGNTE